MKNATFVAKRNFDDYPSYVIKRIGSNQSDTHSGANHFSARKVLNVLRMVKMFVC